MAMTEDSADGAEERTTATRHLGLDLGGTNLKWTVVAHDAGAWRVLGRGRVKTRVKDGPAAIVDQLGETGRSAMHLWPGVSTVGVGIPGLYDPRTGRNRFLVNI